MILLIDQNNINAVQSCTLKEINALLKVSSFFLMSIVQPLPKDLNEYLSSLYTKYYSNKYNESYINDYYDLYLHMNEFGGPLFRVIDRMSLLLIETTTQENKLVKFFMEIK